MSARRSRRLSGRIRSKWALLGSPFEPLMFPVLCCLRSQSAPHHVTCTRRDASRYRRSSNFPLRPRHANASRASPSCPCFSSLLRYFRDIPASLLQPSPSDPRHCLVFSSEEHMQAGIHTLCSTSHTHSETLQILSSTSLSSSLTHHVSPGKSGLFSPKYLTLVSRKRGDFKKES